MLKALTTIVQGRDTRAGRAFDWCVIALILLSLVSLTLGTLPDLSPAAHQAIASIEIAIAILFTLEYAARIATARHPLAYVFSGYGLVDLAAIVPFYFGVFFGLQALRTVRLFRLLRLLKLVRYSKAMRRFAKALSLAKEEAVLFLIATIGLLFVSSVGIYFFENQAQPDVFKSIPHSFWWAVATLTTVGYGDVYPVTVGGRVFTFLMLMIGLGVVAVPAGLVASAMSQVRREEAELSNSTESSEHKLAVFGTATSWRLPTCKPIDRGEVALTRTLWTVSFRLLLV